MVVSRHTTYCSVGKRMFLKRSGKAYGAFNRKFRVSSLFFRTSSIEIQQTAEGIFSLEDVRHSEEQEDVVRPSCVGQYVVVRS